MYIYIYIIFITPLGTLPNILLVLIFLFIYNSSIIGVHGELRGTVSSPGPTESDDEKRQKLFTPAFYEPQFHGSRGRSAKVVPLGNVEVALHPGKIWYHPRIIQYILRSICNFN